MPQSTDLVLWLALCVGFSPAIAEFVRSFGSGGDALPSTLLAPALVAICVWRRIGIGEEPRRVGLLLVATGLLLELLGVALRTWSLEWFGFPVAVTGMAIWLGNPSWRVAVLAFGLVAVPASVRLAYTPGPETLLLSSACSLWAAVGIPFSCTGPVATLEGRRFELGNEDVGWILAPVLAQLGWYLALCEGASGPKALRRSLATASATAVIQPLAVFAALGLFAVSSRGVARAWLSHGVWLACTVAVLAGSASGWRTWGRVSRTARSAR